MLALQYVGLFGLFALAIAIQMFPMIYSNDQENSDDIYNSFCQEYQKYQEGEKEDNLKYKNFQDTPFLNKMSCLWMKKERAFWIWVDGFSNNQLSILEKNTENESAFFNVQPPLVKASGQIHDTYINGRYSTNMLALGQKYDNIFKQMSFQNMETKYMGIPFPMDWLAHKYFKTTDVNQKLDEKLFQPLCQGEKFDKYIMDQQVDFDKKDPALKKYKGKGWTGWEDVEQTEIEPHFEEVFKNFEIPDEIWEECLNQKVFNQPEAEQNTYSLMYYTTLIDHQNHWWGKGSLETYHSIFRFQKQLESLKNYLDKNHPEIPLIVSSDHGGQIYVGEDIVTVHGYMADDNKGLFYIHSDYITEQGGGHKENIDQLDVSATAALMFKNNNIPLLSQGTPKSIYDDDFNKFLAAFAHWNQLKQHITVLSRHSKKSMEKIKSKVDFEKVEEAIKAYEKILQDGFSLDSFFDENENSKNILQNSKDLNRIDNAQYLTEVEQANETLKQGLKEYQKNNKKDWVFALLIILSLACLFGFMWLYRSIILSYVQVIKEEPLKEKCVWIIGFMIMFSDALLTCFIIVTEQDFLYYSNYVFIGLKVVLLPFLPWMVPGQTKNSIQEPFINNEKGLDKSINNETEQNIIQNETNSAKIQIQGKSSMATDDLESKEPSMTENNNNNQNTDDYNNNKEQDQVQKEIDQDERPVELRILSYYIYEPIQERLRKLPPFHTVFAISFIYNIISIVLTIDDSYMRLKLHEHVLDDVYYPLNILLYIIFYLLMVTDGKGILYGKKDGVQRNKYVKQIDIWAYRAMIITMTCYDFYKHDKMKTLEEFYVNIVVMVGLIMYFVYKIASVILPHEQLEEGEFQHNLLDCGKLMIFSMTFYIVDIPDQMFLLLFVFPITYMYLALMRSSKILPKYKIIAFMCLIREAAILYIMMAGSFEFGYNRAAANNVLGRTIEDTPVFGAQLQGLAKIQTFVIPFVAIFTFFLLRKNDKSQVVLDEFGKVLNFLLVFKTMVLMLIMYCVLAYTKGEYHYFEWLNMFYVGHILLLFYLVMTSTWSLEFRYSFCFKTDKYRLKLEYKKIIVTGIAVSYILYLYIANPYF